ncbi:copper resistance CopC/CopD family protein [Rhizobium sp. BK068]|uniref:copper resistance CopC/CopD family protein n=1 Tax=Rhizobium sp. BK068 TaxID=2512130 RepID=UPI001FE0BBBC|nr:copper resistance CopC/CopD family protein [Rhizobium sp. BK068]
MSLVGLARLIQCLVVMLAGFVAGASGAYAHASLVSVEPADGSVVGQAPKSFAITFSEPVSPLVLKLVSPDGSNMALQQFALRDNTLDIVAPADLGDGTYVLSWRVISEDGHPVGGSAVFSIGHPSAGSTVRSLETIDWPVRISIWLSKVGIYCGFFFGIGTLFFTTWIGGGRKFSRRVSLFLMLIGATLLALSLGLQGLDALGQPLSHLVDAGSWQTGYGTTYGWTVIIGLLSFLSALLASFLGGALQRTLTACAVAGVGLALAASGHASAAHPQWLTRPAVFLHAVGIVFWAGALIPLGTVMILGGADKADLLRRFSRAIPFALVLLVAAGTYLAVVQLASPSALWSTDYGRVLSTKILLLVFLFALAAINRYRLTSPAEGGDLASYRWLGRSIAAEIVIVALVFSVAAIWRFTPPPRALAAAAAASVAIHIHGEKAMVDVQISPGGTGPSTASLTVLGGDFSTLDAKEVGLVLSQPDSGIEQIKRPAHKIAEGTWRVDDLTVPVAGKWKVRVDVLISDFEIVRLEDEIDIRP